MRCDGQQVRAGAHAFRPARSPNDSVRLKPFAAAPGGRAFSFAFIGMSAAAHRDVASESMRFDGFQQKTCRMRFFPAYFV